MQTKQMKWILLAGSIPVILCCLFCCLYAYMTGFFVEKENPTGRAPIRTIIIESDPSLRDYLGDQLNIFSEQHDLKVETAFYTGSGFKGQFFYVMYGENLEISAYFRPEGKIVRIGFFEKTKGVSPDKKYLDNIYEDLKDLLGEIPGVVIVEEK